MSPWKMRGPGARAAPRPAVGAATGVAAGVAAGAVGLPVIEAQPADATARISQHCAWRGANLIGPLVAWGGGGVDGQTRSRGATLSEPERPSGPTGREGFEPPVPLQERRFSRPEH